ncbi:ribosomal protein S12 methylthiotransferase RimO [Pseudonocardia eucalypti]|uniref:30S ribosomal protein S12 methylthiotransferase RimO n=1 Tax=Pseudonocardia eucalypti TaxID=648755 RepID=UPI00161A64A8|nr:ribosomal protein S12 methylthiotransferase RimO [Pseudonocardia eucalypti]
MPRGQTQPKAALVTLGCARNDLDSEELAGRLTAQGWSLVDAESSGDDSPDVIVVNTCGFVAQAKKDSIDTVLAASDAAREVGAKVVAVGCLAERYGAELAAELPEADAVLGFDQYSELGARLSEVVAGRHVESHKPVDRRTLLPISPVSRPAAAETVAVPGHGWVPDVTRRRLDDRPVAPLKLASGCDRRCAFCAIPSFRGSFVSRPPAEVLGEAAWLAEQGVRELVLVSENSTSYGKDLGDLRSLEALLPRLAAIEGIERVRVSYLQPAETRPGLIEAIAGTPGVADYFDLSFQHASEPVLRRMRRFGSVEAFLDLCNRIRALAPDAGIRSNVIVGFPGETEADLAELERFLTEARLDAVGVFGYSDEDGTEAVDYPEKVPAEVIAERVARVTQLAEELTNQRAEDRIGSTVRVLVEELGEQDAADEGEAVGIGRAAHQAPEVDGECILTGDGWRPGELVDAVVLDTEGVDLVVARGGPR